MIKTPFGLALAGLLLISDSAFADEFTFLSAGNVTWNGVYVNPYSAKDNTQPQNNLSIYCDDWNTDFSGNPTWTGEVYALTANNVPNFRFGNTTSQYDVTLANNQLSAQLNLNPNAYNRYLEVAWLNEQWRTAAVKTTDMQIKLAAAMWTLFVDTKHVGGLIGAINASNFGSSVYQYLEAAQTAVAGGYSAAGWDVIVPVGQTRDGQEIQEFLVYGFSGNRVPETNAGIPLSPVPEPSAVILLGTVLGYLGLRFRKRTQR